MRKWHDGSLLYYDHLRHQQQASVNYASWLIWLELKTLSMPTVWWLWILWVGRSRDLEWQRYLSGTFFLALQLHNKFLTCLCNLYRGYGEANHKMGRGPLASCPLAWLLRIGTFVLVCLWTNSIGPAAAAAAAAVTLKDVRLWETSMWVCNISAARENADVWLWTCQVGVYCYCKRWTAAAAADGRVNLPAVCVWRAASWLKQAVWGRLPHCASLTGRPSRRRRWEMKQEIIKRWAAPGSDTSVLTCRCS